MKVATIIDGCIRVAAAISAVAFLPIVLVVGIMADDSGTPAGERATLLILGFGSAFAAWVLLCSTRPSVVSRWLQAVPRLRFMAVTVPTYVFGLAGISWCVMQGYASYKTRGFLKPEVQMGEVAYPQPNPHPTHPLQIGGTLPTTVPITAFVAVYTTDAHRDTKLSGPCQRVYDMGPRDLWCTSALTKKETIPISVAGERYSARVYLDRYMPGQCNWHLSEIYYQLTFRNAPSRVPLPGLGPIQIRDEQHRAADAARGEVFDRGPGRVWCGKALNLAVTPYYPVHCGDFSTFLPRIRSDQSLLIPNEEEQSHSLIYALPGMTSVELDFYDADSPVKPSAG